MTHAQIMERRDLGLCVRTFDFELRGAADAGDGLSLEGYAAVFNSPTRIRAVGGDFDETILPGAFARSIGERVPVLQWDHGRDPAVGTAPIGDITDLREDDHGLYVRARLYAHPSTDRVRMAIKGRSVRGMSFRFGVPDGGDSWSKRDGVEQREIRDADVHELGPVVFPAYDATSVSVRSLLAQLDPDEYRVLVRELAAELRAELTRAATAVDSLSSALNSEGDTDPVGRPGARSSGGDGPDPKPETGTGSPMHLRQRLDDGALRIRGIKL